MIKIYEVGGSIRDRILGLYNHDRDFAVEADSYKDMKDGLIEMGLKIWLEKPEFFTIRGKLELTEHQSVDADFVLCRSEGSYGDGRRPDVVRRGTIYEDLARRDFTMNAMAIDMETGKLLDPHNGMVDIELGIIKCVGLTADRMREDGLRMIRAIRFSITKNMALDDEIVRFLRSEKNVAYLENVSEERIREELRLCFAYDTLSSLKRMEFFPDIRDYVFGNTDIWLMPTNKER